MTADPAKKAKIEQVIVAVLLLVFVTLFMNSLRSMGVFGGAHRPAQAAQPVQPAAVQQAAGRGADVLPQAATGEAALSGESTYSAQDLRDPLQSLLPNLRKPEEPAAEAASTATSVMRERVASQPPALDVQGLWWQGMRAKAMIRGKLYGIGDEVEGVKITKIGREGVTGDFEGTPVHFAVTMRR